MKSTHNVDAPFSKAGYISLIFHIMPQTTNLELKQTMRAEIEKRGIHNIYRFKLSGFYSPFEADFNFDDLKAEYKILEIINEAEPDYAAVLSLLITQRNRQKAKLDSYHLYSVSDIEELERKVDYNYRQYTDYQKKASSATALVSEALLFASSVFFVILASYYYFKQIFFYSGTLAFFALAFNFAGCILHFRRKRLSDKMASFHRALGDIMEEFLQEQVATLTDESYGVLKSRLSEFKALMVELKNSELQMENLLEKMVNAR